MDKLAEFAGNHPVLMIALMMSFFIVVISELRRKAAGLVNVDAIHAVKLINNNAQVIDLRSAEAFANGHIVGARNIPADELEARLGDLGSEKTAPIVTICEAGMASTKAVTALRAAGFDSAYGVKGGMAGWSEAGLPVVAGKKTKAKNKKARKN